MVKGPRVQDILQTDELSQVLFAVYTQEWRQKSGIVDDEFQNHMADGGGGGGVLSSFPALPIGFSIAASSVLLSERIEFGLMT